MSNIWINFIKAKDFNNNNNNNKECEQNANELSLNGNQIKEFYESVINSKSETSINSNNKKQIINNNTIRVNTNVEKQKIGSNIGSNISVKEESIFKYCQNGEIDKCLEWLQMGFDINIRDQYLWTPLMCSSCAGHQPIVELLLQRGADDSAEDRRGRNAINLALINGHKRVIESIINHKKYSKRKTSNKMDVNLNQEIDGQLKKCDICGEEFSIPVQTHQCSIGHQIDSNLIKSNTFYQISEQNRGFQIMLRNGWHKERGLGKSGTGRKFPIKTVLKRDRLGFGNVQKKAKLTHFSAFDTKAVDYKCLSNSNSKQSRNERLLEDKKQENKLKRIEIKFRQDFR